MSDEDKERLFKSFVLALGFELNPDNNSSDTVDVDVRIIKDDDPVVTRQRVETVMQAATRASAHYTGEQGVKTWVQKKDNDDGTVSVILFAKRENQDN